ncbi:hypothetical protein FHT72_004058 [Rhizobium sp. BK077]|nr:hypothetical protein [Rhizobium sp. BK112]MBB3369556.1 hypothetical protein [Rhizobium sp. BK077]MBB4179899.1 hypothetical protein [Rhizobium sp. BK109]
MASNLPERRDHTVEVLHDDLALDLHMVAKIFRQLDLVTVERAVRLGEVVGLEGAFGGDRHRLPGLVFRMRRA